MNSAVKMPAWGGLQYKIIHQYKMADTSTHYKKMKDLMAAEVFMAAVKDRQFQCVDDTANRIDNAACQKPSECSR